jgi:hypothetical protein
MASPVLSVQKHTLTIPAPTKTDVGDLEFVADSAPDVIIKSATNSELPTWSVGDEFVVEEHSGAHDGGAYVVKTITTPNEEYVVTSIDGATGTAAAEDADVYTNVPATADLTGTPATDTSDCIPFVMTRVTDYGTEADAFMSYGVRASFVSDSPNKIKVQTGSRKNMVGRALVCEVTVVEFNSDEVNVYQGEYAVPDNTNPAAINDPFGVGVDVVLNKSFLYFTATAFQAANFWKTYTLRGVITDVDTLTFDVSSGNNNDAVINWYVAEAINSAWDVYPASVQLADAVTTNASTTFTAVDPAKTFVLGSYMGSEAAPDGDGNEENTIDITLTESVPASGNFDEVTATRIDAQVGDGVIDWAGFVVELNGSENVYRGAITTSASSPDTDTVTSVTAANSWVHTSGHTGILGGGMHTDDSNSNDAPGTFGAWTLVGSPSSTQVSWAHDTTGGQTGGTVTWEVVEWDVGGAPPATRRVMVIS